MAILRKIRRRHIMAALIAPWVLYYIANQFLPLDFWLLHSHYASIVAQVKSSGLKVGEEREWTTDEHGRIHPFVAPGLTNTTWRGCDGDVMAKRKLGGYTVSIVVRDEGHLGMWGYIFFDGPLRRISDGNKRTMLDAPGYLANTKSRINKHWWLAFDNSE